MNRSNHLAARIIVNARMDALHTIPDACLDVIYESWRATDTPARRDLRHDADRRAVARMTSAGRRAGDDARLLAEQATWEYVA